MRRVVREEPPAVTGGRIVSRYEAGKGGLSARAECAAPGPALPCQMSRNCIGSAAKRHLDRRRLRRARTAIAIRENVLGVVRQIGIERVGVLTLTFADRLTDAREAQRRFKSLRTNVITRRYGGYLRVFERQRDGSIHYHLLVPLTGDIRTGYQRPETRRGRYLANPLLRAEWAFLREALPRFGFGRSELEPVRESAEQLAAYFAKSLEDEDPSRAVHDDRVRSLEVSRSLRVANTRFSFFSPGAVQWRRKVGLLIANLIAAGELPAGADLDALAAHFGPSWALRFRQDLLDQPDLPAPTPNPPEFGDEDDAVVPPSPAVPQPVSTSDAGINQSSVPRTEPMKHNNAPQNLNLDFDAKPEDIVLPLNRRAAIELHRINRTLPDMTPEEFSGLTDSIREHGLYEPIVLHEGTILDGRQRYFACLDASVTPRFRNFGDRPSDGTDPWRFHVSKNLLRTHYTPRQLSEIQAKIDAWVADNELKQAKKS